MIAIFPNLTACGENSKTLSPGSSLAKSFSPLFNTWSLLFIWPFLLPRQPVAAQATHPYLQQLYAAAAQQQAAFLQSPNIMQVWQDQGQGQEVRVVFLPNFI